MLKITAPFKEKKEVVPLIEAGADELYCGYISPEWVKKYTNWEFERKGGRSNFTDLQELKEAVDLARQRNTSVSLTLNGLYVNSQYPLLLRTITDVERIDFDAFIVADLGLLLTLKKMKTKKQIHLSTGGTVFNSEAARFYKKLGVSRIILDRQTSLEAMKSISQDNPNLDFEVFILNTLCVNIDGFCTFLHTYASDSMEDISKKGWKENQKLHIMTTYDTHPKADACCLKYSVEVMDPLSCKRVKSKEIRPTFFKQLMDGAECGACAVYDIRHTKVKALKIVGRQLTPDMRLKSTRFMRRTLDILTNDRNIERKVFIHRVQGLYRDIFEYQKICQGNNCYHPEILLYRK